MTILILMLATALGCAAQPLKLSLRQAVDLALAPEGNTRVQLAQEMVRQSQSRSAQARAALLPNLDSYLTDQNQTRNLAAFGIKVAIPQLGFQLPTLAGPFTTFDVRAQATQSILDVSAIRRFQAARVAARAAESDNDGTRDQITAAVAKAYVATLAADARLEAAKSNVDLSEALVKLAADQKAAGTGLAIEVTRAKVQLANQRQQLVVARNNRRQAQLQLLKTMGLNLDSDVELTDTLTYEPVDDVTVEQATAEALKIRKDLAAQRKREDNQRLNLSATRMERLPSLAAFGDYGSIGTGIGNAIPTRTYGVSLRVPVFDGGRRDARRAESASQYRQEKIRSRDLEDQVKLDVRLALDALHSADEQVKVAQEGLQLSEGELAQAERRYKAGVTNSVEVTDAQTRLERARENRIAALFSYNSARYDLGQAMGTIRRLIQ